MLDRFAAYLIVLILALFATVVFSQSPVYERYMGDIKHNYDYCYASKNAAEHQDTKDCQSFLYKATDDPVALFTGGLFVFTIALAIATVRLFQITRKGLADQEALTRESIKHADRSAKAAEDAIDLARNESKETGAYAAGTLEAARISAEATRLAAEAAIKANERERPWMLYQRVFHSAGGGPVTTEAIDSSNNPVAVPDCFIFNVTFANFSGIPAVRVKLYTDFTLVDFDQIESDISFIEANDNPGHLEADFVVGPGSPINSSDQVIPAYESLMNRSHKILLYSSVKYGHHQIKDSEYRTTICGYFFFHRTIEADGRRAVDFSFQPLGSQNRVS